MDCRWLEAQSAQPESCIPSDISAAAKEAAKLAEQVADTARAAGNEEAAEKAQEAGATLDSNDPNLDGVVDVLETVKESAEELSDNDELVTKVDELIQSNKALQDKINKDKGFFDKHGNMIIIGLIIFVGLAILGGLFMMSKSMKPVREIIVEAGRRATETVFSGISFFIIQQFFKYVKVTEVEIKEENGEKVIIEGFFYNIVAIPMNLIITPFKSLFNSLEDKSFEDKAAFLFTCILSCLITCWAIYKWVKNKVKK